MMIQTVIKLAIIFSISALTQCCDAKDTLQDADKGSKKYKAINAPKKQKIKIIEDIQPKRLQQRQNQYEGEIVENTPTTSKKPIIMTEERAITSLKKYIPENIKQNSYLEEEDFDGMRNFLNKPYAPPQGECFKSRKVASHCVVIMMMMDVPYKQCVKDMGIGLDYRLKQVESIFGFKDRKEISRFGESHHYTLTENETTNKNKIIDIFNKYRNSSEQNPPNTKKRKRDSPKIQTQAKKRALQEANPHQTTKNIQPATPCHHQTQLLKVDVRHPQNKTTETKQKAELTQPAPKNNQEKEQGASSSPKLQYKMYFIPPVINPFATPNNTLTTAPTAPSSSYINATYTNNNAQVQPLPSSGYYTNTTFQDDHIEQTQGANDQSQHPVKQTFLKQNVPNGHEEYPPTYLSQNLHLKDTLTFSYTHHPNVSNELVPSTAAIEPPLNNPTTFYDNNRANDNLNSMYGIDFLQPFNNLRSSGNRLFGDPNDTPLFIMDAADMTYDDNTQG